MSAEQIRAMVVAKVWQDIAHSDIDHAALSREDWNKLVDLIVDSALGATDDHLNEVKASLDLPSAVNMALGTDEDEEVILWEGRPFMSLVTSYVITNERIRIIEGLLGKNYTDVELVRIQEYDFKQSLTERTLNLGDIEITSHDSRHPQFTLRNIQNPRDVHEILRKAVQVARKRFNLSYREEM